MQPTFSPTYWMMLWGLLVELREATEVYLSDLLTAAIVNVTTSKVKNKPLWILICGAASHLPELELMSLYPRSKYRWEGKQCVQFNDKSFTDQNIFLHFMSHHVFYINYLVEWLQINYYSKFK